MSNKLYRFFFACGRGLELPLEKQIKELSEQTVPQIKGLTEKCEFESEITSGGVIVSTTKIKALHVALGTTFCSRVLWHLSEDYASSLEELYTSTLKIPWHQLFKVENSFAVSVTYQGQNTPLQQFKDTPLKIKDAIADSFRNEFGVRPNVDKENPDVSVFAHVAGPNIHFYVDILGKGALKHGYRTQGQVAPFSEGLACGILYEMGWNRIVQAFWNGDLLGFNRTTSEFVVLSTDDMNGFLDNSQALNADLNINPSEKPKKFIPKLIPLLPVLFDPMCGSGTLLIEAARMLLYRNSLHLKEKLGFEFLIPFEKENTISFAVRNNLLAAEKSIVDVKIQWELLFNKYNLSAFGFSAQNLPLLGADSSFQSVETSQKNISAAGVSQLVKVHQADFFQEKNPFKIGFCFVNPPYNERLSASADFYKSIGDLWKKNFKGISCWIISPKELSVSLGLRATRNLNVYNGGLPCVVQNYLMY
jgi:23S rRNA G2445 N2-methylase RlmL